MLVRIRIRQTHEDGNLTVGMPDTGAPPLATVQNHFVAFNNGRCLHIGGIGRGNRRLSHTEGGADLAAQQTR